MAINGCPNCLETDGLLREEVLSLEYVVCEHCETGYLITDLEDVDNHEIDRMQRDFQTLFERQAVMRKPEPTKKTLDRLGYDVMEDPETAYPGHVVYSIDGRRRAG